MFQLPDIPKKFTDKVESFKERYDAKIEAMSPAERESKLSRLKAVVTSFFAELFGLEKERNKAGAEADKKVEKTTDEAISGIKAAVEVDDSVEGKPKESLDEAMAIVTSSIDQNLNGMQKGYFKSAFDKVKNPEKGPMDADELMTSAAVGFLSMKAIKKAYPTEDGLMEAFENIEKAGGKSPLSKLFGSSVVSVFEVGTDDGKKILEKFGIKPSEEDYLAGALDFVGVDNKISGDAGEFVNTMKGMSEPGIPKADAIAKVMEEKGVIKYDAPKVVRAVNELIVDGATPKSLARLVRAVDDRDLVRLAALFLDKNPSDIKSIS